MPVIGRAGHHLLTEVLAEDPFGTLYRAVALRDGRFHRHLLVRVFGEELRAAGLGAKLPSAQAGLLKLGPLKAYERYETGDGEAPFASTPYIAGRSLAAIIQRIAGGAAPMPMDSGLALIWSLSQEVAKLRGQGFHHGLLSPHTVWVGFDGQLHVLDAPLAGIFRELMPKTPRLLAALRSCEPPAALDEARRDLWQLGALAYELLTRTPLPLSPDARQAPRREAVEREPLPEELKQMLHRMLGTEGGFSSIEAFNRDMERALFDGEHVPTTFGLAFYMHDIFLHEANADAAALKAEKEEDFFVHTDAAKQLQSRIQGNLAILSEAPVAKPRARRTGLAIAASVALFAAGGFSLAFRSKGEAQVQALKTQVMASERRAAELSIQQSDLDHHDQEEKDHRARVQQQLSEAKDAAVQAELERQLDEARKRQAALEQQQAKLEAEQRKLADARQAYERKAAAVPEASTVRAAAPAPLPAQDAPPRLLGQLTAGYPPNFHGLSDMRVRVRVFVSEQGRAQKAMVMDGDPALSEMARQAALSGAYSPALRAGVPARDWVTVTVPFAR